MLFRSCSGIYALSWAFIGISRFVEFRAGNISETIATRIMVSSAIFVCLLIVNIVWLVAYWPYLLVLMLQLGNAFVMFSRLLRSMWSDA